MFAYLSSARACTQHAFHIQGRSKRPVKVSQCCGVVDQGQGVFLKAQNRHPRRLRCFELFPVVLSIAVVWSCGAIATAAGAYKNASSDTQKYCRTDQV